MNKNKNNICSIFHSRFKNLIQVIPSARKAQLVDYILLGWQTSTYKLKNSDQKWFMKPYAEIVEDTGIPKSTLERYIRELNDEGFIERRQALYSRTKEHGGFEVKKGTYIHITEKLLALIKPSQPVPQTSPAATDIPNGSNDSYQEGNQERDNKEPECKEVDINEGTDPLKMRGSYIRDLYPSLSINTITFKKLTASVDKPTRSRLNHQFETIQHFLYSDIKEEIPDEVKKLVLGTFFNLTFQHKMQFSSPKQVAAEYLFALVNIAFYLPEVMCFKHRNNILSKTIRDNRWRTPKGFYKHFYLGQAFKDKQDLHEQRWQQKKEREIKRTNETISDEKMDERLIQLEEQMNEKIALIDELTQRIYHQSSEEVIASIREHIQTLRNELEALWHQQTLIEQENEQQLSLDTMKRCA
ncbi:hypothetical protein [Legionella fairfieldensis]|uniref:hypothetical protein n=1 Tax=Legionella fairfieldensis TaxID=45064 RepID=UPI00048DFE11|nr:hypothetical protein [Legionella fairfieldensis]